MRILLVGALACTLVAIGGGVGIGGRTGTFVAIALGGTAFVLLVSAAFYAVGQSEDRERAERESR